MEADASTSGYLGLIKSFLAQEISAVEFEEAYLTLFKEDQRLFSPEIFEVLNKLFSDVDAFCADPSLRDKNSIDEVELRKCASTACERLQAIESRSR